MNHEALKGLVHNLIGATSNLAAAEVAQAPQEALETLRGIAKTAEDLLIQAIDSIPKRTLKEL